MKKNLCLSLYSEKGEEIFSSWYSSKKSIAVAKHRFNYLFGTGCTWVVWMFSKKGERLLLSSSRPLPYIYRKIEECEPL